MDKNAIKKYAVWARRELIERIAKKALQYGIEEKNVLDVNADSIGGKLLSASEKKQRQALIAQINDKGYEQVMEEVAYTWFNRFSALRFMEVNGYLPTHVRVFTDEANNFKPQILAEAIHLEMDALDMDKVFELKEANQTDELYKYLLITQCNSLNEILPGMFQKISDYTELLLPDNLLREGSVIEQMITLIEEENWKDQVQIIGWLYQFYNSEPKDELINARAQYDNNDLAYVTQLFTSDWIVRFMVENTLGRIWCEGRHISANLKKHWEFYVDGTEKNIPENIIGKCKSLTPEDIKCIDPCMGSGHVIVYFFDVLIQIYESYGYTPSEAVNSIIEKNLFGLDIDERATQLAYFAIMMKARQYDRRFFSRGLQPNVFAIKESNNIDSYVIDYFVNNRNELRDELSKVIMVMQNAKTNGSIINVNGIDFNLLKNRFKEIRSEIHIAKEMTLNELFPLVNVAQILSEKYTVVVTNPPYMATKYMPSELKKYVGEHYPEMKADLFAIFIKRCGEMCVDYGHIGFLTPYVWMFIQSYEKLREYILNKMTFSALVQLEYNAFEAACVPVVAFTLRNYTSEMTFEGIRLSEFKGSENQAPRTIDAIANPSCGYRYTVNQHDLMKIPSFPIAYWVSDKLVEAFENETLFSYSNSPSQNITGNNNRFVRKHWELSKSIIGGKDDWIFYAKGGGYRKWWGNLDDVVNWTPEAREIYQYGDGVHASQIINKDYWYKKGITWGLISSVNPSFRVMPYGATFDKGGSTVIVDEDVYNYALALLNSKVNLSIATMLNPTLNFQVKDIRAVPMIFKDKEQIDDIVEKNIEISKNEWNSYETSWDFVRNPLVNGATTVEDAYNDWNDNCNKNFQNLKNNEEQLNKILIDLYGLKDELTPDVEEKDVTIRRAELNRDIKNLISYAVGCMFGRYSLDSAGLVYAGGEWDSKRYKSFEADEDNILPICDDEYFEDDIVSRFVKFIEVVYGVDTLQENLKFIAEALGGKSNPNEVIRNYFMNEFYTDHCKMYQKRPIYWKFDSGKKNGFKCLIYMHRYKPDTIMRIRTDYVHEQQSRYRTAIVDLQQHINDASTSERVKLTKKLTTLQAQEVEIKEYEERIHHLADQMIGINLDDGVKNNYEIFKDVLAKIK